MEEYEFHAGMPKKKPSETKKKSNEKERLEKVKMKRGRKNPSPAMVLGMVIGGHVYPVQTAAGLDLRNS